MKIIRTNKEITPFEELEIVDFDDFISKSNKKDSPYSIVRISVNQCFDDETIERKVKTSIKDFNVTPISNVVITMKQNCGLVTYLAKRNVNKVK